MREYKFRAKSVKTNEWVYGSLLRDEIQKKYYIVDNESGVGKEVDENTIGQYTSLKDKNGVKIYEGDIIQFKGNYKNSTMYVVFWDNMKAGFFITPIHCYKYRIENNSYLRANFINAKNKEVIGNIYDNPELLKESDLNDNCTSNKNKRWRNICK